jgi:hypothetical protein
MSRIAKLYKPDDLSAIPALAPTMNIYACLGTKVRFTGYGGYNSDQEYARRYLVVDDELKKSFGCS